MVDDVKKQIFTFLQSVLLEQGLTDLKMDRLSLLLGNEGIGSLLHPVMQEFVAAALRARSVGRIIQLRGLGKTEDQPGFKGRQQVLIELPASGSADPFQRFQVKSIADAGRQA